MKPFHTNPGSRTLRKTIVACSLAKAFRGGKIESRNFEYNESTAIIKIEYH